MSTSYRTPQQMRAAAADVRRALDAAQTLDALRNEVIDRTDMDPDAVERLRVETLYAICLDLDTAAELMLSAPPF